jgi:phosphoacetylglucosamine mutase
MTYFNIFFFYFYCYFFLFFYFFFLIFLFSFFKHSHAHTQRMNLSTQLLKAFENIPLPPKNTLSYGTAGFRARAELLDWICVSMGLLASLRSIQTKKAVGVCVTASHNPIEDNGMKLIDTDGGMLARKWEIYASMLAAAKPNIEGVETTLRTIAKDIGLDIDQIMSDLSKNGAICVLVGADTRPSSSRLVACVMAGVRALGVAIVDYGVVTTPQLHHAVRMQNGAPGSCLSADQIKRYGEGTKGYMAMLVEAYASILSGEDCLTASERGALHIDAAHGVGGIHARSLAEPMSDLLKIQVYNIGETEAEKASLNDGVGAEHCQKERLPPNGFLAEKSKGWRCASLDGDADRLVYWYWDTNGQWKLLDGDKIASIAAAFLAEQLTALGAEIIGEATHSHDTHDDILDHSIDLQTITSMDKNKPFGRVSVGVVQTAYANGASTYYIKNNLQLPVIIAKTGVKHVHAAAASFDVGVYFEANGHGTILFHKSFLARLAQTPSYNESTIAARARTRLLAASRLINQAIGDAISDALFIEAVLALKKWSITDWDALYIDLPSRQLKLAVPDRTAINTTADETRVVKPQELQDEIDKLVSNVSKARAFVRPSGTEDVVRVYAEAETQELAL